ncbi:hypothetical protein vBSenH9_74 [Salmonella phage vB_Sen_H9]|nr:hypothetical protein vBSenH9_74 [Salmonella phage vB_Sen_H9]
MRKVEVLLGIHKHGRLCTTYRIFQIPHLREHERHVKQKKEQTWRSV